MCGIAGTVNFNVSCVDGLLNSLSHRGPDEKDFIIDKNVSLFHTRLSIQDIHMGHQPMQKGGLTVVFNGEIYNNIEIRKKYFSGYNFKTNSDTETLLALYECFGHTMFDKIDGMFSFCIYDKENGILFVGRDRAGKKPFYYYLKDNKFIFASELNAISSIVDLKIEERVIYSYIRFGFVYGSHTPYENILELPAGHYGHYSLKNNSFKIQKYFHVEMKEVQKNSKIKSCDYYVRQLDLLLHKSIDDRLSSSDLEVGSFLSGGIDSNLITAIAKKFKPNLKTFTVKFSGQYDESKFANSAAEYYGTDHKVIDISMNLQDDLEKILSFYGEPFCDSSAIPSYYVSKEAKKHLSVILNGDGADELFGGYRRYVPESNKWMNFFSKLSVFKNFFPVPQNKMSKYNYFYRLLSMGNKSGLDYYLAATSNKFEDVYSFDKNSIIVEAERYIDQVFQSKYSNLQKMLFLDFKIFLQNVLLKKMDIATMSNSLEGRSPFLSKDIIDFAFSIPDSFKINKITTKYILRQLSKKYIPNYLWKLPKRGFEVPLHNWIDDDLKEVVNDHLGHDSYCANYIDNKFIKKLLRDQINVSKDKRAQMIWSLLCLEFWYKSVNAPPLNQGFRRGFYQVEA